MKPSRLYRRLLWLIPYIGLLFTNTLVIVAQNNTPAAAVTTFIDAWSSQDYETMYGLLSTESQQLYTFPVFREIYTNVDTQIATRSITARVLETREQGRTAAVIYSITILSNTFGEIVDENRTMRVVHNVGAGTWGIAWSTMDIFDGMAGSGTLTATSRLPERGSIYDRNGNPVVEQGASIVTLYVAKQEIPDETACIELLMRVTRKTREELTTLFDTYSSETIFPISDIDPVEFAIAEGELTSICSIRTDTRVSRNYVGHGTSSHITGYIGQIAPEDQERYLAMGYQTDSYVGQTGIEAIYEEELAGQAERILRITESGGLVVRELAGAEGRSPQDVTLTIDMSLQTALAQAVSDAYNYAENNWGSREHSTGAGFVVLDVNTGEVLALVSYPTFDPGIFNGNDTPLFQVGTYISRLFSDQRQPFLNRVTQAQYPPGSVFKMVTAIATAMEGLWPLTQDFNCERTWDGSSFGDSVPVRYDWRYSEPPERNFDTGLVTMAEALASSCNPFFYQMGSLLYRNGPSTLMDYARQMGLGAATGIDLIPPAEARGQLPLPLGYDAAISQAVGQQDTQVTILQMARLVAGIANGGTLYTPFIVQSVGNEGETPTYIAEPTVAGNFGVDQQTLDVVQEGMCLVPRSDVLGRTSGQPIGTAWFVFDEVTEEFGEWYPAPYTLCGKTGTAQSGQVEPHSWFVAYAPADNPQIAIAGLTEYSREGSEVSAAIIRRFLDFYFQVSPDDVLPYPYWWYENPYEPMSIPTNGTGG